MENTGSTFVAAVTMQGRPSHPGKRQERDGETSVPGFLCSA